MDGLALLCTLYGDGPVTLRRLREAGLDSIDGLEGLDPEALSATIGLSFEQAARLRREARGLSDRVAGAAEGAVGSVATAVGPGVARFAELGDAPIETVVAPRELFDERGSTCDGADDPAGPARDDEDDPEAEAPPTEQGGQASDDDLLIPHRAPDPPGARPIRANVVDGLDDELAGALTSAGVATLDQLIESDELELARATGVPLTRLLRLRFLARRARADGAAGPGDRFSPAESGRPGADSPGGPFA